MSTPIQPRQDRSNDHARPAEGSLRGRRPRRMSDANLVASLVAVGGSGGGGQSAATRLGRLGLAGLAHQPASRWPRDLGLDEEGRHRLALALELGRRVYAAGGPALTHPADVYQWCIDLREADRERFVALYLDARHRVIRRRLISVGTLTASLVHPREVLGPALRLRAAALVVVHNHPSGDPEPSPEDCALTDRLRDGCRLLGLELLDHVVVAREGFVSLRERGLL